MRSRSSPAPAARRAPHEVRIIGGHWKRTRLPVADKPGLRPTPDRVRETLFNWLGQDLTGWRCVDAFAGTGALGLEAASRGAAQVLLVEQDPDLVATLRALKARLAADAVEVRRANGLTVLKELAGSGQDLVFLDPPFDADLFDKAVAAAAAALRAGRLAVPGSAAPVAGRRPSRRTACNSSGTCGQARCTRTCCDAPRWRRA